MDGFDEIIERRGTGSIKWDAMRRFFGVDDALPLWVADMDFAVAPPVMQALRRRLDHPVMGYTESGPAFASALAGWAEGRWGWTIDPGWVVAAPGVVPSIAASILAFTRPGDGVLIQPPVYYPFRQCVDGLGRVTVENPLRLEGDRYAMDFDDLRGKLAHSRLAILCSPHNPVGRVWTAAELERFGEECAGAGVPVVSDEIHADVVFGGRRHLPFASVPAGAAPGSVVLYAASKSFNLAGLHTSAAVIPDEAVRAAFTSSMRSLGLFGAGIFGLEASKAAWLEGARWLEDLKAYLWRNFMFLKGFLEAEIPCVRAFEPEGTYLAWLDCRGTGLDDAALSRLFLHGARIALDDGPMFGTGGEGFMRLNLACPRSILEEALGRLARAFSEHGAGGGCGGTGGAVDRPRC